MEVILAQGRMRLDLGQAPLPQVDPFLEDPTLTPMRSANSAYCLQSPRTYVRSKSNNKKDTKKFQNERAKRMEGRDAHGNDSVYRLFIVAV